MCHTWNSGSNIFQPSIHTREVTTSTWLLQQFYCLNYYCRWDGRVPLCKNYQLIVACWRSNLMQIFARIFCHQYIPSQPIKLPKKWKFYTWYYQDLLTPSFELCIVPFLESFCLSNYVHTNIDSSHVSLPTNHAQSKTYLKKFYHLVPLVTSWWLVPETQNNNTKTFTWHGTP